MDILKYLFFLVLGIIIFVLYNSVNNFSVGIPYLTSDVLQRCAALMNTGIQPEQQPGEITRIQLWKATSLSWDQRWFLLFNNRIDYYQGRILRGTITLSDINQISLVPDGGYGYNLSITLNSGRVILLWNGGFSFANIKKNQTRDETSNLELFKNLIIKQTNPDNSLVTLTYLIYKYNYIPRELVVQEQYTLYEITIDDEAYNDFSELYSLYEESGDTENMFAVVPNHLTGFTNKLYYLTVDLFGSKFIIARSSIIIYDDNNCTLEHLTAIPPGRGFGSKLMKLLAIKRSNDDDFNIQITSMDPSGDLTSDNQQSVSMRLRAYRTMARLSVTEWPKRVDEQFSILNFNQQTMRKIYGQKFSDFLSQLSQSEQIDEPRITLFFMRLTEDQYNSNVDNLIELYNS